MCENSENELRTVRFKAIYWSVEETDDNECIIHVSGLTKNQETVQVQVEGFTPYVYLELPRRIKWTKRKCDAVFKHFKNVMKHKAPLKYKMFAKSKLHFKKKINCMFFTFPTGKACRDFGISCSRSKYHISGVGSFSAGEFKAHEQNIDAILKFTASRKISLSGWLEVKEHIKSDEEDLSAEERKFSSADIDLYADWKNVKPHEEPDTVIIKPKYCSFDIECYSKNHNAREPNADDPKNVVFQISMIFGRLGEDKSTQKKILLSLFNPLDIEGVEVIRCRTERELLLKFKDLVQTEDPDIFISYNGMKFDWNYMIQRAEKGGFYPRFMDLSRIIGKKAELQKSKWASSAYGEQAFKYPNCHGRTNVDVILEVERNYRLPQYSLKAVGEYFLKETKDDISHRQLFMLYQLTDELLHLVQDKFVSESELRKIKWRILDILPLRLTHGVVRKLRKKLLLSTPYTIEKYIRKALTLTGKYCVQDTVLPIKLVNKLNLYTTMEQMSNVMHVPMSYLHTRGQQIKVLAQIFRETIFNNLVIPFQTKKDSDNDEKYQGAIVIEANPGDYDNVGTLDFASLYPTTMIAFNICYTTILEDDDPTPDEDCHVLSWQDHIGCEHDPQKRKKKKEDVMCTSHRYRFLKVKIEYNEETGEIIRKNEGLMPRLERNLLATRKQVKKEMFKAEARLKMHKGEATEDDIVFFKKCKFEIIEAGSLGKNEAMMLETIIGVLNAKQLAVKVSANSVSAGTPIPCLVKGKIEYKYIEELFDRTKYTRDEDGNEVCNPPKNIKVWSDKGWSNIKYVFRHETSQNLHRVLTHTGCVDVTKDHSLLDSKGTEITIDELNIGDDLYHYEVPLPSDTPDKPYRTVWSDCTLQNHPLDSAEEKEAFLHGLFLAEGKNIGKEKKILSYILNAPYKIRLAFFVGYYSGNKSEHLNEGIVIQNKECIETAGIYYLLRSLGYKVNTSLSSQNDSLVRLECNTYLSLKKGDVSRSIKSISHAPKSNDSVEYVYDIETSSHHFAAGVGDIIVHNSAYGAMGAKTGFIPLIPGAASVTAMGRKLITKTVKKIRKIWKNCKLVYGDTDSCMLKFEGATLKETFEYCTEASKRVTHYLKSWILKLKEEFCVTTKSGKSYKLNEINSNSEDFKKLSYDDKIKVLEYESVPIDLEFEKVYGRFLLLTKKRYVGYIVNKDGKVTSIDKKGVVLARRDNSNYLRLAYKKMTDAILDNKSEQEVMYILYDEIDKLFTRQVPDTHLIIYTGVKNVMNYAKKKEKKSGKNVIDVYYLDSNKEPIDDPIGPLDPRLVYPNYPQCLLSLKMLRRGTDVPSNTRLEYLYLENNKAEHQGEKAEDYTYYKENKEIEGFKPDYLHYIEKQLSKPVTELLEVKYPREPVLYEKLDDALTKALISPDVNELKRSRVAKIRIFTPEIPKYKSNVAIGWDALRGVKKTKSWKDWVTKKEDKYSTKSQERKYKISGKEAKVTYIIDSAKRKGMNEFDPQILAEAKVIDVCKKWKARSILDRLYRQNGLKKRPHKKPTQTGDKLRINTKVILLHPMKGQAKGAEAKIIDVKNVGGEGKLARYKYELLMDGREETIIRDVSRKSFTTFYIRDSTIMKDILRARAGYKDTVEHLKELFSPVVFVETK